MNWEKGFEENIEFWSEVFNPMGYVDLVLDPTEAKAREQALHFSIKSAMVTTAATGVWALSGGGASMGMWFGAEPPTTRRMLALKADTYRQMLNAIRHAPPYLARAAPYAAGAAVVAGTTHAIQTGDTKYTLQHQVMMPVIEDWLSGLGKDGRGGSEYGLFYR